MKSFNYVPFETATSDNLHPYLDELLDLDVLCTEEGIFINILEQE